MPTATARRVLVAASSRLAFRAFSRWRGLAAEIREAEVKTRRAAQRMLRRHFARAFYQWADTAAVLGRERAERERALRASDARAKLCERFFLAARRRELSAAFAGFRDIARRLARTRRVVGKSLHRLRGKTLARAFDAWADNASELRRHRALL